MLVPSSNVVHTCICLLHKSLAKVLTVLHKHVHVKFGGYKFMFFHFDERLQEPLKNGAGKRQCVHHPTQQQKLHQLNLYMPCVLALKSSLTSGVPLE